MAKHPEQISQGCVALINLILSSVILFVLVLILMPGFIDLPKWAEDIRGGKLIEKRKVKGAVKVLPNPSNPSEDQLIIFNSFSGGLPIKKILNKNTPESSTTILVTSQKIQTYQRIWDKVLPDSDIKQFQTLKTLSDFNTLYLLYHNSLRAWSLKDGKEIWNTSLEAKVNPACNTCFQVSLDFKVIVVLSEDQNLYVIDINNGKLVWEKNFKQRLGEYPSFHLYKSTIGLLEVRQEGQQYTLLNILTGEVQKEIPLPQKKTGTPLVAAQNQLFYFTGEPDADETQLQMKEIEGNAPPKNIKLPKDTRLPSISNNTYKYLKEWCLIDNQYIFLKVILKNRGEQILKVNRDNARLQKVQHPQGYEVILMYDSKRNLLVNARKLDRNASNEIWLIDKREGKKQWTHSLTGRRTFLHNALEMTWDVHLQSDVIILIEGEEGNIMEASVLSINNGAVLKKKRINMTAQKWDGVTWTEDAIWLSAQEVYRIDLERYQFYINREFP